MDKHAELKIALENHLRSSLGKNATPEQIGEIIDTLISFADYEVDRATLESLGKALFDDPDALAKVELSLIVPILKEMRVAWEGQSDEL